MTASLEKASQLKLSSFIEECMSSMWIGSLYKNGPTQHICMSGVHSSTYFSFGHHWIELTNILQCIQTSYMFGL